jgi:MFS family permease
MTTPTFTAQLPNISRKNMLASVILVANAFVWYLYIARFLTISTDIGGLSGSEVWAIRAANIVGTALAAVSGGFWVRRVGKRLKFLIYWMLAGVLLSLAPLIVNVTGFAPSLIFFVIAGVYFGLGMPVSLAYFAASTETDNRSRLGGITFFVSVLFVFILALFDASTVAANALLLAGCKAVGLGLIVALKPPEIPIQNEVSYRTIAKDRAFILYLVPWVMFSTINYMAVPMVEQISRDLFTNDMFMTAGLIENVLGGVLAVVFGFASDYMGRKRLVVVSFALLGFGYACLGLTQNTMLAVFGWWFYTVVDGVAWGAFSAIFLMTIWGDLAGNRSSERYYAIGLLPFLCSFFTQTIGGFVVGAVNAYAVFSFASLFLFVAVLPIAYAPETLNLKEKEFKRYINKAVRTRTETETQS